MAISLHSLQICSTCNKQFKVLDNLGTWQCRYHPLEYDDEVGYLCCKRKIRQPRIRPGTEWLTQTNPSRIKPVSFPQGCQMCDHSLSDGTPISLLTEKTLAETLIQSKYYANESFTMPGFDANTMLIHRSAASKASERSTQ